MHLWPRVWHSFCLFALVDYLLPASPAIRDSRGVYCLRSLPLVAIQLHLGRPNETAALGKLKNIHILQVYASFMAPFGGIFYQGASLVKSFGTS